MIDAIGRRLAFALLIIVAIGPASTYGEVVVLDDNACRQRHGTSPISHVEISYCWIIEQIALTNKFPLNLETFNRQLAPYLKKAGPRAADDGIDTNNQSSISLSESLDTNDDHLIDGKELATAIKVIFLLIDEDENGLIDGVEAYNADLKYLTSLGHFGAHTCF